MLIYRATALAALSGFVGLANAQKITVVVNGDTIPLSGQQPVMSGDRVLIPLRGVLEKMGASVEWDPDSKTVRAFRPHSEVKLKIGDNNATVNGKSVSLDVPASIIKGSTMVPLRFVGESLGETVHWNAASNTVSITNTPDPGLPHTPAKDPATPAPTTEPPANSPTTETIRSDATTVEILNEFCCIDWL